MIKTAMSATYVPISPMFGQSNASNRPPTNPPPDLLALA